MQNRNPIHPDPRATPHTTTPSLDDLLLLSYFATSPQTGSGPRAAQICPEPSPDSKLSLNADCSRRDDQQTVDHKGIIEQAGQGQGNHQHRSQSQPPVYTAPEKGPDKEASGGPNSQPMALRRIVGASTSEARIKMGMDPSFKGHISMTRSLATSIADQGDSSTTAVSASNPAASKQELISWPRNRLLPPPVNGRHHHSRRQLSGQTRLSSSLKLFTQRIRRPILLRIDQKSPCYGYLANQLPPLPASPFAFILTPADMSLPMAAAILPPASPLLGSTDPRHYAFTNRALALALLKEHALDSCVASYLLLRADHRQVNIKDFLKSPDNATAGTQRLPSMGVDWIKERLAGDFVLVGFMTKSKSRWLYMH